MLKFTLRYRRKLFVFQEINFSKKENELTQIETKEENSSKEDKRKCEDSIEDTEKKSEESDEESDEEDEESSGREMYLLKVEW